MGEDSPRSVARRVFLGRRADPVRAAGENLE